MVEYRFTREDVLRTRFAISPLFELTQSVAVLAEPARHAVHLPWLRAVRPRLAGLDLSTLRALVITPGYIPDFISPPPETPLPDVEAELERVRAIPADHVRREIGWAYEAGAPRSLAALMAEPERELAVLVDLMRAYWERAIAPFWEAVRAALESDVVRRARQLTAGGAAAVFADLHPLVSWRDGSLLVDVQHDASVELGGRGLLLVPSAFVWPRAAPMYDPPWQPGVIYSPPGVGDIWEPSDPAAAGALAGLLGAGRARILAAAASPVTTTDLAARLQASAAGVSAHLGVLRRAGLVRARREGRRVLYDRTGAGDALVRAAAGEGGLSPGSGPRR